MTESVTKSDDGAGPDLVERWDQARARYEKHDDELRAVITWIDDSRAEVAERQKELLAGRSRGPLHGLLVGLKDNIDTAGVLTTSGARFLSANVPTEDAHVTQRLRASGAVVVAKLNLAEAAWGATTQNVMYGACRNPWDTTRIPGGSSGGSGSALAARYCDLSLGTDTGASVRIPSAVNGVVGLRPTYGSISNRGILPTAHTQDTVGPMALRARLAAELTRAVAGHDPRDPYSVPHLGEPATARLGRDVRGMRVGIPESFFYDDLESGVAVRVQEFLAHLGHRGVILVPVPDFGQAEAFEHWTTIVQSEGAGFHEERVRRAPEDFSDDVRGRLEGGLQVTAAQLARSLNWRARYRLRLAGAFAGLDAMVTPCVPVDVPPADGYDSREQTRTLGRITYPWALHAGPTLSLPIGFHPSSGLPVSIAVSAAAWNESRLFQIADDYQHVTQWHEEWPALLQRD
ncbi:amidase [Kineosporia succinea]|uniref:Aspartyl-tRNA(Asn)/glutamyl-tRNA(Gln) amidotransferase subunit A n=1 Tax=Kineosporia succinea TaxID=84632 RepID=A0ABT9PC77_9ACTN|nr:amidase [Kineosporia succinea]MDP9830314.1 aspartyl-tRNA(Asn)/glutamyl-tRNA(Gln) amidotransferase subunit A [Kineosporia succinea]